MCRTLAERLGYKVQTIERRSVGRTLNGEPIWVIGKIRTRWWCTSHQKPKWGWPRVDPRYHDGQFYITEFNCDFDVVFGINTINQLQILKSDRNFVAPITALPEVDEATVQQKEREAAQRRKLELEEMKRHDAQKGWQGRQGQQVQQAP
jgi:hypothetical protein